MTRRTVSTALKTHRVHSPLLSVRGCIDSGRWLGRSGLRLRTAPPGHSPLRTVRPDTLSPQRHTPDTCHPVLSLITHWFTATGSDGLTDVAACSYESCWTLTGSSGRSALPSVFTLALSFTVWTITTLSTDWKQRWKSWDWVLLRKGFTSSV